MCGIAGVFNIAGRPVDARRILAMSDTIRHRGPDAQGYWAHEHVGLGHVRLSIIDLTLGANQPMASPDGRFQICYNGELYNFKELRAELIALGEDFATESDTEVFLRAYIVWGEGAFVRMNGMFAAAIYDLDEDRLVLVRDRFGVKPLYIGRFADGVAFASEAKAIFASGEVSPQLDRRALAEYLTFMNFIGEDTIFKGVTLLPAGTIHVIERRGREYRERRSRFWDFRFADDPALHDRRAVGVELEQLFRQAVERQLVSDVGVSTFLSGGVDSGSITAVASGLTDRLRTFTCGFDTSDATGALVQFDERGLADVMARRFHTEHYSMLVGQRQFERVLQPLCRQLDEPRVGQSYPNYLVSGLARQFEKVVLSGAGGDELFGGYPWRYFAARGSRTPDEFHEKYFRLWRRLIRSNADLERALAPIGGLDGYDPFESYRAVFADGNQPAPATPATMVNAALYFEAKTFLNGLLIVEDKVAMHHSLETRVPFLDNDLADYAMRIPASMKLDDLDERFSSDLSPGAERAGGKSILREMMASLVPEEVHKCPKLGFSAPDELWWRTSGKEFIHDCILGPGSRLDTVLDRGYVQNEFDAHQSGQNRRHTLWAFVHLSIICDEFSLV